MSGAKVAAAVLLLACALQHCAAQLPGMLPMPPTCTGALNGPAPRSDLSWPANETKLSEGLRQADRGKGVDLIFYGDSIFWEYNGDNLIGPVTKLDLQRRAIFQGVFKSYSFRILALPGDQSGNLLWRLQTGGEFPTVHMPKTVVILIGTNDLTYADCDNTSQDILNAAPGIISRVTQTVQYIHGNSPKTQIVLVGVLPRGAQYWDKDQAWVWPNRYTDAIAAVNAGYYALAQSAPEYIKYVYCGKPYAYEWGMNPDYVEDGLHPNQAGLELLAACIKKDVDTDMSSPQAN